MNFPEGSAGLAVFEQVYLPVEQAIMFQNKLNLQKAV